MSTASALARTGRPSFHDFPQQVEDLSNYLWRDDAKPLVSPKPPRNLPLWMLGSSADSAVLAAHRGLPYNLGAFINANVQPSIIRTYKDNFQPSLLQTKPYAILAMSIFCAETEEQARVQQRTFDVNFYRFIIGQSQNGFLPPEQAMKVAIEPQMQMFMDQRDVLRAVGTPDQVAKKIEEIATRFHADEIMAVTNMYGFEERQNSFSLLMSAF